MVSNWDVRHFGELAAGGYLANPDGTLMAFFPGLPVLLSMGLGPRHPGRGHRGDHLAGRIGRAAAALLRLGGPWAAVAWLFAPTAVFTTVPYTESLFCAAAFWAWERARADRWLPAAILTALACTLRVSGLFLIGALLVMIITSRADVRHQDRPQPLMADPRRDAGVFAGYLYLLTGSWTAWYTAQKTGWVRELTWPWESFRHTIPAGATRRVRRPSLVGGGVPGRDDQHVRRRQRGDLVPRHQRAGPASGERHCGERPAGSASRCWRSPCPIGFSRSTGPRCSGSRCGS